jgi:hypothetical protein
VVPWGGAAGELRCTVDARGDVGTIGGGGACLLSEADRRLQDKKKTQDREK